MQLNLYTSRLKDHQQIVEWLRTNWHNSVEIVNITSPLPPSTMFAWSVTVSGSRSSLSKIKRRAEQEFANLTILCRWC